MQAIRRTVLYYLLAGLAAAAVALAPKAFAGRDLPAGVHRQLLDHPGDAERQVELFWSAPPGDDRRPAVLFVHGHRKDR